MMRLLAVLTLGFLTVASTSLMASEIETDSVLTAATVYADRAVLTRRAEINIPAGEHIVIFRDMPTSMLVDSLRAEGKASGKVIMGALTHRMETSIDLVAPREKELHDQIKNIEDQRKVVEAEQEALAARQNFIATLGNQVAMRENESIAELRLSPDSWVDAANTIHEQMSQILKASLAYESQKRNFDDQLRKLRAELNQLHTGARSTYTISLPIESESSTKITIDLSYQVPDAEWHPVYDARLNTLTEELELVQYGVVQQNTGEDWANIKLTLSTAQPHRGATLPELSSMWVDIQQPYAPPVYARHSKAPSGVSASFHSMEVAALDSMDSSADAIMNELESIQVQQAEIATAGYINEYIIPGLSSVKADGSASKLKIGHFEIENNLQIQIKPQLSTKAFLVARAKLKGEAPILPGQVNLFRDGAFVGQMSIPMLRPEEQQDIGFGIDDQVSVTQRILKDERSEAGIIVRDSAVERHFLTEIKNLHKQPVNIVVMKTIPVARDEGINVAILPRQTLQGYESDFNNIKGLLRWDFKLDPGADKYVNLGWKTSWPRDKNIEGL
ncbi:MAG: mucoidy inhibitor MuiA family protein [Alphaproteobacteria bacterium]